MLTAASTMSLTSMDVSFLPRLDPLSKFYPERLAAFNAKANEYEKIFDWISDRFDEEITSQLVTTELGDGNKTLRVLGIGSGDGIVEVKMLKQLKEKFPLIECIVVEPGIEHIARYKELVDEQKDALKGVTFDWRQETIQEFCKANADASKKFHFVSAIHSCYYIARQDLDFYLKAIYGWTKGKILIMIGPENGCICRLERKLLGSAHPSKGLTHESGILDTFRSLGVSFETSVLPSECDITSCFESNSRDGKLLFDFLLQRVGCRDDGPPELLKIIQAFLESEGISYTRNGRLYVGCPVHVILASA